MSLDFNDIVKQGEVKLKSRTVGVWQKRWIIFRKKSSSGPRRLEKYPDLRCAEIGQQVKSISLEKVRSVTRINNDGRGCMIEIQPEDGPQRFLLFAEESEAAAWEEALRFECLENPSLTALNGDHLPNAINGEMFHVNLIPSMALALSGECLLQVTSDDLILFDITAPSNQLMSWPLHCLRRYGGDRDQFMFESGRHCNTGEGLFIFSTVQGERIYQKVHSATTAICEAHRLLRRDKDGSSPRDSLQNGRSGKRSVGHSISLPLGALRKICKCLQAPDDRFETISIDDYIPPVPPPRPQPSPSDPLRDRGPATRTSSLPARPLSSMPNNASVDDAANNNLLDQATGYDPEAEDAEKYLDATFVRFLAARKDDTEPPPSQRLLSNQTSEHL